MVICLTLSLLAGCVGNASGATGDEVSTASAVADDSVPAGKTQLNVAVELFSFVLEPSVDWESWYVMRYGAGETLVRYGKGGVFEPWLAESWEVASDDLTWTFKLRKGVKFSNGEDMTATKVVQSIARLFELEDPANGGKGNPQGHFTYTSITADDAANTVTIVTTSPVPDMPGCMAYPWTLIIDVDGSADRDIATEGPICTGPYAFASFTQDSDVQMVKNKYYWDGEAPFETVNIMKVVEPSTRTMALQDGSVDMALNIFAADREILTQAGGFTINKVAGSRTGYAHINMESELGNDVLRRAVMMAIDGQTIADVITNGAYTYGYAVVPSSLNFGYDKLTYQFNYAPTEAARILDEAGIVDSDGDGYRELNGAMIDLNYPVTSNRQMHTIAQAQATQLESIGIKCTVQVTENQSEILNNHMFDLCNSNEVTTPTGDPAKFLRHWYSTSDDNYSNYNNPKYDAIFDSLSAEFDPEARKEYMTQLQQILLDDAAVLVYGYFNYNICTVDTLTGVNVNANDFYWVVKDIKFE
jgi:peptide/nickel transport system substrate-binding protein